MLEFIERPCAEEPRALMVWLHGLGADAYDLEPIAEMLGISGIHHVLPHAPVRPVTLNGGMAMRAWYDIANTDLRWREDRPGLVESSAQVCDLISQLNHAQNLPVLLAGFSQGAVISLMSAATGIPKLAGVAALSGYVPQSMPPAPNGLVGLPIFMAHGHQDDIIPFALAQQSRERLIELGADLTWHAYDMPHSICQEEIFALANWVELVLGGQVRP